MIRTLAISGYRSIRDLVLPLDQLTVVTGKNGTGKSSFYRALRLLAEVAQGRVISTLAAEGGLQSTLWAGPERISRVGHRSAHGVQGTVRKGPVSLRMGMASDDYGYAIDLGLPIPQNGSMFNRDPIIKAEAVWAGEVLRRRNVFAERAGPLVKVLDRDGNRTPVITDLPPYESMMTYASDPKDVREIIVLRDRMRGWRFYDHFRTDPLAPARMPRIGTRTTTLAADGSDLAAALQTIREIGDFRGLDDAIEHAFPGARIDITESNGNFELLMHQYGLLRAFRAAELSDGTLRYLLLLTALLTPRPPDLMVLNEPEASLHPDLLKPLARMIRSASANCQIVVVTHAQSLVDALDGDGARTYELEKDLGETTIQDLEQVPWAWPSR